MYTLPITGEGYFMLLTQKRLCGWCFYLFQEMFFFVWGCRKNSIYQTVSSSLLPLHYNVLWDIFLCYVLTHWGRVTHICVSKLTIIGSDNGLSPDRRQAIIWTNAGLLLIGPLGTNFSEILIKILTYSFKKMRLKVSSAKRRPFCLGLNVLIPPTTSYRRRLFKLY